MASNKTPVENRVPGLLVTDLKVFHQKVVLQETEIYPYRRTRILNKSRKFSGRTSFVQETRKTFYRKPEGSRESSYRRLEELSSQETRISSVFVRRPKGSPEEDQKSSYRVPKVFREEPKRWSSYGRPECGVRIEDQKVVFGRSWSSYGRAEVGLRIEDQKLIFVWKTRRWSSYGRPGGGLRMIFFFFLQKSRKWSSSSYEKPEGGLRMEASSGILLLIF